MPAYCGENFLSQLPPKFFPQPTNTRHLFLTEARLPPSPVESRYTRYQALKLDKSTAIYDPERTLINYSKAPNLRVNLAPEMLVGGDGAYLA